jgi:hypothetical protein
MNLFKWLFNPEWFTFYAGGGGGGQPRETVQTQTTIPEYARPYVEKMLGKTEALTDINKNPYQAYGGERIAGFTPMQQQAFQGVQNMQPSQQLNLATGMAGLAGLRAGQANYQPTQFSNAYQAPGAYQPGSFNARDVSAQQIYTPQMAAAQTAFSPQLQQFQMGAPERVGVGSFARPGAAEEFMSPYQQAVTDIEKREAIRASNIMGQQQQAQAAQRGAFGGSRSALIEAERQRNLGMQLGDIQARGSQNAFQQAREQFNAENLQAGLQAQLANQQAGLTAGGQNLSALLGVQQLGTQTGLQTALANLNNQQQANVQNLSANLQAQGMSSDQALRAALANQQAGLQAQTAEEQSRQYGYGQGMTASQLAAQYGTEAQRMAEQSRQFGAGYGMQGIQQQLAAAGQLGALGQTQFGQQKDILQGQLSAGAQQRDLEQQRLGQAYQDFQNQRQYPYQQLAFMSDMLRGLPLSQQSQQMYSAPPSMFGQMAGAGLTYMGAKQAGLFGAAGGSVPSGLARVAANKLMQG